MYQDEPEGSHLRLAVDAASLAAFSNYFKANDLSSKAEKAYGTALTALNNALQDQAEAKLDQTLTAVLNLLMFEVREIHKVSMKGHNSDCVSDHYSWRKSL